jgi:hypothetical protein
MSHVLMEMRIITRGPQSSGSNVKVDDQRLKAMVGYKDAG